MFLENIDLFPEEEESNTKPLEDEKSRESYVPKLCASELDFKVDFNGAKSRADLCYFLGQYKQAKLYYKELYVSKDVKSAFVRRDVAESLSRTCLALGQYPYLANVIDIFHF